LCHDDGSNSYVDTFNFLPWSGSKNYLGYNKTTVSNYFVMADAAPLAAAQRAAAARGEALEVRASPRGPPLSSGWNACIMSYGTQKMPLNLTDVWASNTCSTSRAAFFAVEACDPASPFDGELLRLANNTWSSETGAYALRCGKTSWTLAAAQALGVDVGSVVVPVPATADVIAAGRALLQM